jgi:hypothetical protein
MYVAQYLQVVYACMYMRHVCDVVLLGNKNWGARLAPSSLEL